MSEVVTIVANDDAEEYQFLVNGSVCTAQAYDGIKDLEELPEIFEERTRRAVWIYQTRLGPFYHY